MVEAVPKPPQTPSVAYQLAPPERDHIYGNRLSSGGGAWPPKPGPAPLPAPEPAPEPAEPLQRPSEGPSREEWARGGEQAALREHAERQAAQDRAALLESSGLDELEPVAVPG